MSFVPKYVFGNWGIKERFVLRHRVLCLHFVEYFCTSGHLGGLCPYLKDTPSCELTLMYGNGMYGMQIQAVLGQQARLCLDNRLS